MSYNIGGVPIPNSFTSKVTNTFNSGSSKNFQMFYVDIPRGMHQLTILPTIIRHYDNNDNGTYETTYEFTLDHGLTDGMYTANALAFVTINNTSPTNVYNSSSLIYTVPTGS